jgi:hypothetical protein
MAPTGPGLPPPLAARSHVPERKKSGGERMWIRIPELGRQGLAGQIRSAHELCGTPPWPSPPPVAEPDVSSSSATYRARHRWGRERVAGRCLSSSPDLAGRELRPLLHLPWRPGMEPSTSVWGGTRAVEHQSRRRRCRASWGNRLAASRLRPSACSFGLSATSQHYFSLRTNRSPATSQQYFSLRTNQHQSSATSQTNRLRARLPRIEREEGHAGGAEAGARGNGVGGGERMKREGVNKWQSMTCGSHILLLVWSMRYKGGRLGKN